MENQHRKQALSDALDSFRLEFLSPSTENIAQFDAWLNGQIGAKQLMESAYEIWQQSKPTVVITVD